MGDGLCIGEVATATGVTRKALRLYEARGILMPRRGASGYRLYDGAAISLVKFVVQARRLGFALEEIKEIVTLRRSGRLPCPHIRALVRRKTVELDRALAAILEVRRGLQRLLRARAGAHKRADECPDIDAITNGTKRRTRNGQGSSHDDVAVPVLNRLPGSNRRPGHREDR